MPLDAVGRLEWRDETVEQELRIPLHPGCLPIGCGEGGALEMDIVRCLRTATNVRKFFGLLLKKNGYVLEMLFFMPNSTEFLVVLPDGGFRLVDAAQVVSEGRSGARTRAQ